MSKSNFLTHPPMGWNSYDYYDTAVNEQEVRANAEYMAEHLKAYGWEYVVVDIEWYAHRPAARRKEYQYLPFGEFTMDAYARLLPDEERFPSSVDGKGFAPLAEYVHSLGLKFGIHIMRGIPRPAAHQRMEIKNSALRADDVAHPYSICRWNPDMYGVRNIPEGQAYYDSLLELYAEWGVDLIKCDDICNTHNEGGWHKDSYNAKHEIEMLSNAIQKCGRDIVLSLSPGPALIDQAWHYEKYANMWRITDDFWDDWKALKRMFYFCELWQKHVGNGNYPDCDMLPLGKVGKVFGDERDTNFTKEEQRTMLSLWSIFGAPLMLGAELTKLDPWTLELITNQEVLEMDQMEKTAYQYERDEQHAIWIAKNKDGAFYLCLFNLGEEEQKIAFSPDKTECIENTADDAKGVELWNHTESSYCDVKAGVVVKPHDCMLYRFAE